MTENKKYFKNLKALRPKVGRKRVLMSSGLVLNHEERPIVHIPRKQKEYQSFVAEIQFEAQKIQFDILFAISSLALFYASALILQVHHIGRYCMICTSKAFQASNSLIVE